jgi:hypothetical protein
MMLAVLREENDEVSLVVRHGFPSALCKYTRSALSTVADASSGTTSTTPRTQALDRKIAAM